MTESTFDLPPRQRPNTALAFLLAPGIAAGVGGIGAALFMLVTDAHHWPSDGLIVLAGAPVFFGFFFALAGYPTAAIIGVPTYLLLPERARGCFAVVVPLAGAVAAAPWICADPPWRRGGGDVKAVAAIAFVLGVVAGIAFLFLRRVPDPEGGGALP